jgi:hypothetical protein
MIMSNIMRDQKQQRIANNQLLLSSIRPPTLPPVGPMGSMGMGGMGMGGMGMSGFGSMGSIGGFGSSPPIF